MRSRIYKSLIGVSRSHPCLSGMDHLAALLRPFRFITRQGCCRRSLPGSARTRPSPGRQGKQQWLLPLRKGSPWRFCLSRAARTLRVQRTVPWQHARSFIYYLRSVHMSGSAEPAWVRCRWTGSVWGQIFQAAPCHNRIQTAHKEICPQGQACRKNWYGSSS